ncbi:MAG: SH3 domain-containing protein [Clostridiales bacterium]|nr:SH3 domain-containing protein [Clostridiales bacterium]
MKRKMIAAGLLVFCMLVFSGCGVLEVIQDILSVNDAEIHTDDGPKVTISKPTAQPSPTEEMVPTAEPTPTPTEEPENIIYCISPVNVRAGSSNQSQVIGALASGDAVEMLGQEGGWIKIRYEGQEAWVYEKYMTSEKQ